MAEAKINTKMLRWARERTGMQAPDFAAKCGVSPAKLDEWESGLKKITFNQAQRYAEKAHIPFGYLFLKEPPADDLLIPDLRTLGGSGVGNASAELKDIVKIMLQRQEWYREYLKNHFAGQNPYVGCLSVDVGVETIVSSMREALRVPPHPERGTWDEYYRELVERIESIGIMVMRQANIGHHSRPLRVEEFRGFAIADELAPVIFVNHADCPGARLFTLLHELCHIWIGESGISDGDSNAEQQEEILCNAVAAEFLVPSEEFLSLWDGGIDPWLDNLPVLEANFHVSKWVLARRALTLNKITKGQYEAFIADQEDKFRNREKKSGGPTYYRAKKAQLSNIFSRAVVTEALNGQLLLRDAGHLLGGIKPNKIKIFARELGV
ncbi:XRE family transcriptional regulator [Microbulbifer hainanensis]|uniref:XRE family transcriptional regulator n=1 Tax=Microbulbifer hainanensis TaxID=2735675 RepID=UPI001866A599|nr:XRE family transcriptional regulator [Microbulbifer hainanensis]